MSTLTRLPELLTADEAAAYLRVSTETIYRAAGDGRLEVVRLGRGRRARIRVPVESLLAFGRSDEGGKA